VLIDTARADMTTGHPDSIVALLVQAEKARPTRNPEPLRPEVYAALLRNRREFLDELRFVLDCPVCGSGGVGDCVCPISGGAA
jgi:hypothetical protein